MAAVSRRQSSGSTLSSPPKGCQPITCKIPGPMQNAQALIVFGLRRFRQESFKILTLPIRQPITSVRYKNKIRTTGCLASGTHS